MKSNYHDELSDGGGWCRETQPALVKGLQVGFLGLALGCHQAWKFPQSVLASQSPRAADPGTRSSWPYIRLSAARPECHPESTALNSSYTMPRGTGPDLYICSCSWTTFRAPLVFSVLIDSPLQAPLASSPTPSPASPPPSHSSLISLPSGIQWSRSLPGKALMWQPTPVFFPWAEEPSGLQSMGSQRVRHDWAAKQQTSTVWAGLGVAHSHTSVMLHQSWALTMDGLDGLARS